MSHDNDNSSCPDIQQGKTHFGYETIDVVEKTHRVAAVFHSVAHNYDVMNDVMSLGIHRLWKKLAVDYGFIRPGNTVLDIAGGTGDLSRRFLAKVGPHGRVVLADINASMLEQGRTRLTNRGLVKNIDYVQANAEGLPFANNQFDCISIAFGLRNVTNKAAALSSMYRVLKPGGRLLVLEFSKPQSAVLKTVYDAYSFNLLPKLGQWIAQDADSYRYLAESIRMHPDQETLKQMIITAGFDECRYLNLTGGIVALHTGYKY